MALHIRDPETDRLVRSLAESRRVGLTEAVKIAVENELRRGSYEERLRELQDRIAGYPKTGLTADKAFYDSLED